MEGATSGAQKMKPKLDRKGGEEADPHDLSLSSFCAQKQGKALLIWQWESSLSLCRSSMPYSRVNGESENVRV